MTTFICTVLLCVLGTLSAKEYPPRVQVYSHDPGVMGKENVLICHVRDFHPPEITIKILKNGVEIPKSVVTDLAFEDSWHFYLTKHVQITPSTGDMYTCEVTHMSKRKVYTWDPDM